MRLFKVSQFRAPLGHLVFLVFGLMSLPSFSSAVSNQPKISAELVALEQTIAESEAQYTDIVPGTEKSIRWFDGQRKQALSIVYIHGFSASAKEISPIPERLATRLNANLFFARLSGHGRSADAMADASIDKWKDDALHAFSVGQAIGDKVILISTSTGGTLATWLAAQPNTDPLHANILVSPNFGIANRVGEVVRWPIGFKLAKWIAGPYREFTPLNELHKKYWTERYPIEAVVPMVKLVDEVQTMAKRTIRAPHLILYSPRDQVINVERIYQIAEQLSSAEVTLRPFNHSEDPYQHVLGGDACSPSSTDTVVEIMHQYLGTLQNL